MKPGKKYLVERRDGSVPVWPWFVLAASDPCAAGALFHYAGLCEQAGYAREYVDAILAAVTEMQEWAKANPSTRPDVRPLVTKPDRRVLELLGVVVKCRHCQGAGGNAGIPCNPCHRTGVVNLEEDG